MVIAFAFKSAHATVVLRQSADGKWNINGYEVQGGNAVVKKPQMVFDTESTARDFLRRCHFVFVKEIDEETEGDE